MDLINFLDCVCAGKPIPTQLADIVKLVYTAIQIGVPIILILVGMFDMGKAITQQKEDEIKKAQGLLVKKAIAAALVFLMLSLVLLVLNVVGGNDTGNVSCITCLLTGEGATATTDTKACILVNENETCEEGYTKSGSGDNCKCTKDE